MKSWVRRVLIASLIVMALLLLLYGLFVRVMRCEHTVAYTGTEDGVRNLSRHVALVDVMVSERGEYFGCRFAIS